MFGSSQRQHQTGLFGNVTTPGASSSLFGGVAAVPSAAPTTSTLFGTQITAPQSSTGLFGGASRSTPQQLFSSPRVATPVFGGQAGPSTSLFGGAGGLGGVGGHPPAPLSELIGPREGNPPHATDKMSEKPQMTWETDLEVVKLKVQGLTEDMLKLLVKIPKSSTVKDLKDRICGTVSGITPEQMQLIHRGMRLRNSDYIRDLHLSTGDKVYYLMETQPWSPQKALAPKELLPQLSLPGYSTSPSIIELARMSAEELSAVKGFSVQNEYGIIEFLGETDVRELDLDAIVRIEEKVVIMYPEKGACKPSIGKGLNKPARIRLFDCRLTKTIPLELFEEKIRKVCARKCTEFESYNTDTGEWVFRANHF